MEYSLRLLWKKEEKIYRGHTRFPGLRCLPWPGRAVQTPRAPPPLGAALLWAAPLRGTGWDGREGAPSAPESAPALDRTAAPSSHVLREPQGRCPAKRRLNPMALGNRGPEGWGTAAHAGRRELGTGLQPGERLPSSPFCHPLPRWHTRQRTLPSPSARKRRCVTSIQQDHRLVARPPVLQGTLHSSTALGGFRCTVSFGKMEAGK